MRTDIVHSGAGELTYEIRNIVNVGNKLEKVGLKVNWENIGDPVAKGEAIPQWMKEIVAEAVMEDSSYAYSPTKGVLATREFIAAQTNSRGKVQITAEDIIFFNGLGDAISKVFGFLRRTARILPMILRASETLNSFPNSTSGKARNSPVRVGPR